MMLRIKKLRASTILGVHEWERKAPRPVLLDIVIETTDNKAGDSDDLKDAVDYALIEQRVLEHLAGASYYLLEKLAAEVAKLVLALDTRIAKVTVEADKPGALAQAESVSVRYEAVR